jgi:aryl-alcohol dehydrogenase-like predicted oxidoreductase
METTTLGNTGIEVSRIGFGGAPAGITDYLGRYTPEDREQRNQVVAAIERAVELGVTYFDTAASYGKGASERIFGEALRGHLDRVFLATKVAPMPGAEARASVEASLERLGCDCVDLVQVHGGSYSPERRDLVLGEGGTLEALEQLRSEGSVRFVGFTAEDQCPAVYEFIETGRFDVMQICYNLIFQHPAEPTRPFGCMYEAEGQGMSIVTMRTVTSGVFQHWVQLVNPDNEFDYSPALIQFVLSSPLVDVALIGMRTPDEVERNVAICEDMTGRIDIDAMHHKFMPEASPPGT